MQQLSGLHASGIPLGLAAMEHVDPTALLTAGGTIFTGALASLLTYLVARRKGGVDAAAAVTNGFQILLGEVQAENVKLINRLDAAAVKLDAASGKIDDLTRANAELKATIHTMSGHVDRLERAMTDAGLHVPAAPNRT